MSLKSFLGLVEIRTKLASMMPFLLGTIYSIYRFHKLDTLNFLLMFASLICIDMATTALNNFFDFKRAQKKQGYNYEIHNTIVKDALKESTVVSTIILLLIFAATFGILLVSNSNIIVLATGMLSFLVGISYSLGPVPISKTPFGEAFSGIFMGFVIIFLSVYIHIYNLDIVSFKLENLNIFFHLNLIEASCIFMFSIPAVCTIANIMLANNICDLQDDLQNNRRTLPSYIGSKNALRLFNLLYIAAYLDLILLCLIKILPYICLLSLLTIFPVYKNIKLFNNEQSKKETFSLSVKNFLILNGSTIVAFCFELLLVRF